MSVVADLSALDRGRVLSEQVIPGLESALAKRYDALLPGFSEYLVGTVYGDVYSRDGLDLKTRQLTTVAALAALGGQTLPQLKVHISAACKAGATRREVAETLMQMGLYGGFPAMINALNAALEVFAEEDQESNS